jgi:hypothetical protein
MGVHWLKNGTVDLLFGYFKDRQHLSVHSYKKKRVFTGLETTETKGKKKSAVYRYIDTQFSDHELII